MITTRKASLQDLPEIESLAHTVWKEYYPSIISMMQIEYMLHKMYSQQSLKEQIEVQQHDFTLACDDNKIISFISISPDIAPHECFLNKFYTHKNYRGIGIGKILFNHITKDLINKKLDTIRLVVNRKNEDAIGFYKKLGFKIEAEKDTDIGKGYWMNDYLMVKNFNA